MKLLLILWCTLCLFPVHIKSEVPLEDRVTQVRRQSTPEEETINRQKTFEERQKAHDKLENLAQDRYKKISWFKDSRQTKYKNRADTLSDQALKVFTDHQKLNNLSLQELEELQQEISDKIKHDKGLYGGVFGGGEKSGTFIADLQELNEQIKLKQNAKQEIIKKENIEAQNRAIQRGSPPQRLIQEGTAQAASPAKPDTSENNISASAFTQIQSLKNNEPTQIAPTDRTMDQVPTETARPATPRSATPINLSTEIATHQGPTETIRPETPDQRINIIEKQTTQKIIRRSSPTTSLRSPQDSSIADNASIVSITPAKPGTVADYISDSAFIKIADHRDANPTEKFDPKKVIDKKVTVLQQQLKELEAKSPKTPEIIAELAEIKEQVTQHYKTLSESADKQWTESNERVQAIDKEILSKDAKLFRRSTLEKTIDRNTKEITNLLKQMTKKQDEIATTLKEIQQFEQKLKEEQENNKIATQQLSERIQTLKADPTSPQELIQANEEGLKNLTSPSEELTLKIKQYSNFLQSDKEDLTILKDERTRNTQEITSAEAELSRLPSVDHYDNIIQERRQLQQKVRRLYDIKNHLYDTLYPKKPTPKRSIPRSTAQT